MKVRSVEANRNKTQDMIFIALFAVLIAICSWIAVPMVIPISMQTFAVFLALNFLGAKKGTASVCIYLLLGAIGIPVYTNGNAGIGALFGKTGGYMIGWIFSGLVMWALEKLIGRRIWAQAVAMLMGLLVCYVTGTLWFMFVYDQTTCVKGLWAVLGVCVFPFVIPDIVKLGMALWMSRQLKKVERFL